MRRALWILAALVAAATTHAQTRPVFEPDDFVDPRQLNGMRVFASRLVLGGVWNFIDDYRPANEDIGFVHVANSFYVRRVEFDYKHSETTIDPRPLEACACQPTVYFPTPPPPNATPAAPAARSKDTLQAAFYVPWRGGEGRIAVMHRYRLTWSRRNYSTEIISPQENRRRGREQVFGFEGDISIPFRGRDLFGSLQLARTSVKEVTGRRDQTEFTYSHKFPGTSYKQILFRAILTTGGITNRGGTAINLVNPYFEAFLHQSKTRVNFHLVYSPQFLNSGAEGWRTHHQVALFADWGVVQLFGTPKP
jgi:hypothetical protein